MVRRAENIKRSSWHNVPFKGKYSMTARNVNPIGYYQMMAEPGSSGGAVLNSKMKLSVSMRSE